MGLSTEAIIALVGLAVALPPVIIIALNCVRERRHRRWSICSYVLCIVDGQVTNSWPLAERDAAPALVFPINLEDYILIGQVRRRRPGE